MTLRGNIGKILLGVVVVVALLVASIQWGNARTSALNKLSDCVVATARAQGYSGNVYSQEAWNLFVASCGK